MICNRLVDRIRRRAAEIANTLCALLMVLQRERKQIRSRCAQVPVVDHVKGVFRVQQEKGVRVNVLLGRAMEERC